MRFVKGHTPYRIIGDTNPNWKGGISKDSKRYQKVHLSESAKQHKRQVTKQWEQANRGKLRNYQLLRHFGITLEDYNEMLTQQNGMCLICKQLDSLHVDHNHETGEIRGLLCGRCNRGLGMFRDSTLLLLEASKYLDTR